LRIQKVRSIQIVTYADTKHTHKIYSLCEQEQRCDKKTDDIVEMNIVHCIVSLFTTLVNFVHCSVVVYNLSLHRRGLSSQKWRVLRSVDSSNVRTMRWLPQSSLLAHPQTRLFISHCGLNALFEAAHYGVPVLAIPLSADQHNHAAKVSQFNFPLDTNQSLTGQLFFVSLAGCSTLNLFPRFPNSLPFCNM